ncbi:hypothetical protein VZT92_021099 [Zoarces viviparus]|uniref:Dynein heavy chain tail domain-containing protein n=1 Tax=Zoarces viviparus TaxID=48416 RepID=A0AAW1EHK1_ZOAVI
MDEEYSKTIRQLFIRLMTVTGVPRELLTDDNERALDQFIDDTSITTMVVYVDTYDRLRVEFSMPSQVEQLTYFSRIPGAIITAETFDAAVQFGTVRGGSPTQRLLREMTCLHAPAVALSTDMERNIKDEYTNQMHCFLVNLTDAVYNTVGNTVLYIPMEALQCRPEVASKDKKLIQRMESVMIHWADQVKKLLSTQEIMKMREKCGPLQEIAFWKSCSAKLSDISQQLQKPGVRQIQKILLLSKSRHVKDFCKLAQEIQEFSVMAQSNTTFLSILKEPLEELARLKPSQVAPKLQHIVSLIRIIYDHSPHYNTKERITGLFHKMSNEINRLCFQSISLDRIFKGYALSSKQNLNDCIQCCLQWKEIYQHAAQIYHERSPNDCVLDQSSFVVVVDVSIQRFKELLEICECQYQFARWEDGQQRALPCFWSSQGPEFTHSLLEIEDNFNRGLKDLQFLDEDILDVESTTWRNKFIQYRAVVKDLEMKTMNLINSVFKTVYTVEEGVRLLYIFRPICSREAIKRTTEEKVEEVINIFHNELQMVNKELNQKTCSPPDRMPRLTGKAHWLMALRQSLATPMEKAHFLPESYNQKLFFTYSQMVQVLDEMERKSFSEWNQRLDGQCLTKLEQPLMVRREDRTAKLNVNFDNNLLNIFSEIDYWDRLKYEIPQCVSDMPQDREGIRCLSERALLLVTNYNRIIGMLSPHEWGLFQKQIGSINKKIEPGLTELPWSAQGAANFFIQECLLHVNKVKWIVDGYKASNQSISNLCRRISETLLVKLDGKTVYRNQEFEDDQKTHQQSQLQILRSAHQNIVNIMTRIHKIFSNDGPEVQEHWVTYTEKVDHLVEQALRGSVKHSMEKLSMAIIGDSKTTPNPLFIVRVALRQATLQTTPKVEFFPTLGKLAQIVNIMPRLIDTISEFKRLPEILSCKRSDRNPIHKNIEQDEEIRKIQAAVVAGMTGNASQLQVCLKIWDKYRDIWQSNQDSFIQRYESLNPPATTFDADIHRYTEKAYTIQQEDTFLNIWVVTLDCSPIKSSLAHLCSEWQTKFTELLSQMATTHLKELHGSLQDNSNRLRRPPQTLAEFGESMKLLETLQGDLAKTEDQILLIHDQFAILDKYEVPVEQAVQVMREVLDGDWVWFQQVLIDSEIMLQKEKESFTNSIIPEFLKKIKTIVQEFNSTGPFDRALSTELALNEIVGYRCQLETLKEEESAISHWLGFFETAKSIQMLEKDLDHLQQLWEITQEWNANWDIWKVGQLSTQAESTAQDLFKKLLNLQGELKDKEWDIVDSSKDRIDQFKQIQWRPANRPPSTLSQTKKNKKKK